MSQAADGATPSQPVCQPFTFGGVAAFARAGVSRLLVAELIIGIVVAVSIVYFLHRDWSPVVAQAIQQMPESAKISDGRLSGVTEAVIAETKFFAIAVTPQPAEPIGQSADLQIQLRPADFRIGSVFRPNWGLEFDYKPEIYLPLRRSVLDPWWGAWQPVILATIGVSVVVGLFGIWAFVAVIYTVPAKFITWFTDRELTWKGAWKLSSASLLGGALLIAAATLLYGWQAIDLIGLGFFYLLHMVTGWVFLIGSALTCPRLADVVAKPNPFTT